MYLVLLSDTARLDQRVSDRDSGKTMRDTTVGDMRVPYSRTSSLWTNQMRKRPVLQLRKRNSSYSTPTTSSDSPYQSDMDDAPHEHFNSLAETSNELRVRNCGMSGN